MPFTPKTWQDSPSTATPLSAAALQDLETRLAAYADSLAGGSLVFTEPFASLSAYATDVGGAYSVSSGTFVPSSSGRLHRTTETVPADHVQSIKFTTGGTGQVDVGLIARRIDDSNFIYLNTFAGASGTPLTVAIGKRDGAADTTLVNPTGGALAAGRSYWLVARLRGNRLRAEVWDVDPRYAGAGDVPLVAGTTFLAGADATKFGSVVGNAGLRVGTNASGATWDDHTATIPNPPPFIA